MRAFCRCVCVRSTSKVTAKIPRVSKQLGVGGKVSFLAGDAGKEWAAARFPHDPDKQRVQALVLSQHTKTVKRRECLALRVQPLPHPSAAGPADESPVEVLVSKVRLETPGPPAQFFSAAQAQGVAPVEEEGAQEGGDEGEQREDVGMDDDLQAEAVEEEEEEEVDSGSPVKWGPWAEVAFDARATAGHDRFPCRFLNLSDPSHSSVLSLFEHLLPGVLVDNILLATNNTGGLKVGRRWRHLGRAEFILWLGYWFAMGLSPRHRADHWAETPEHPMQTGYNFGNFGISRQRFDDIVSAFTLHVTHGSQDPLFQVRKTQETFNSHMVDVYRPSWLVCVDESVSAWTQRWTCPVWVILPRKPTPMGIEFHTAADSANRILFRVEMVGDPENTKFRDICEGKLAPLVLRMTEPLFGGGNVVALDSGFGALEVIRKLQEHGLYGVAIIKKKRYWPKHVGGEDLKARSAGGPVGSVVARCGTFTTTTGQEQKFYVVGQRDSKACILAMSTWGTTTSSGGPETRTIRRRMEGEIVQFTRPSILAWYYHARHAVDDSNNTRQGTTALEDIWGTKDWKCRVFAFFLGVVEANVRNAYNYLAKKPAGSRLSLAEIRLELVKDIVGKYVPGDELEEEQENTRKRAAGGPVCSRRVIPKRSSWNCTTLQWEECLTTEYPQRRCVTCGSRTRLYCHCNPSVSFCTSCMDDHLRIVL